VIPSRVRREINHLSRTGVSAQKILPWSRLVLADPAKAFGVVLPIPPNAERECFPLDARCLHKDVVVFPAMVDEGRLGQDG
jgi:hypothetical protein